MKVPSLAGWRETEPVDIRCGSCGSEELVRDPDAEKASDIPLKCLDCGWKGRRTPSVSCGRCGSAEVDQSSVENSWAYDDLEEARENPTTVSWEYIDKTVYRCRKCYNEWTSAKPRPRARAEGQALRVFRDDDQGYVTWIAAWPNGFVLNCERKPRSAYVVLHRANCRSISALQPGMETFTKEYIKVCSTDRHRIRQWTSEATGAQPDPCQLCM